MEREALQAATAELYAGEGVLDGGGAPAARPRPAPRRTLTWLC